MAPRHLHRNTQCHLDKFGIMGAIFEVEVSWSLLHLSSMFHLVLRNLKRADEVTMTKHQQNQNKKLEQLKAYISISQLIKKGLIRILLHCAWNVLF